MQMVYPNEFRIFRLLNTEETIIYLYINSVCIYKSRRSISSNNSVKLEELLQELIKINNDKEIALKFGIIEIQYFIESFE